MSVAPYNALIPEIARTDSERVELARLRSVIGGPIIMTYGILWLAGIKLFKTPGMDATMAIQVVVVISCCVSFFFCMCPIFAVKEHELGFKPNSMDMKTALTITLRNRPFIIYLFAQIILILGITMSGPAIPYFARVILGRDEGFAATLSLTMLPGILLGFVVIPHVVARLVTKNTLVISVLILGLAHIPYGFLTPSVPGDSHDLFNQRFPSTYL